MPTHWESSTRPLFVKTVVVNGNRHAILTQEDPLGHAVTSGAKRSRPTSPRGGSSTSGISSGQGCEEDNVYRRLAGSTKLGKSTPDLQSCLVKLRVVLATQRHLKPVGSGAKQPMEPLSRKRRHSIKTNKTRKDNAEPEIPTDLTPQSARGAAAETPPLNVNQNITVANFFTEPTSYHCSHHIQTDRIVGNSLSNVETCSTAPTLGISADFDVSWNNVSSENYFTRPFYNRLSERVMQWLNLSSDKIQIQKEVDSRVDYHREHTNETPGRSRRPLQKWSSEDNSDEVRTDEDVETVLSKELPRFSRELNRQHFLKSSIPAKPNDYSMQLQESIAESFNNVVSIGSGKSTEAVKVEPPRKPKRKGHLTRQIKIEESSDDDLKWDSRLVDIWDYYREKQQKFKAQAHIVRQDKTLFMELAQERIRTTLTRMSTHWQSEQEGKPQLHIFIPAIQDEEVLSEAESLT